MSSTYRGIEGMILIPSGEFIMGTDDTNSPADQRPAHQVYPDAFYIDKYEVTNRQYEQFIIAGGYQKKQFWTEEGWEFITKKQIDRPLGLGTRYLSAAPNQPVVGISWYEANAYARWAGKRLPTEAEWEKASRGTNGKRYPWGMEMDFTKVFYHFGRDPAIVGSYPAGVSHYGVFDMAGNVWEWCADWYDEAYYLKTSQRNPRGPAQGTMKVMRGGSWNSSRMQMQCTYRDSNNPDYRNTNIGFRCVRDAK